VALDPTLVLGSASPRRREILERIGVSHVVIVGSADETVRPGEAPLAYLERIVDHKLAAVRAVLPADLRANPPAILVADTSVVDGPNILGKPLDALDGRRMIRLLSGRTHEVSTRFAVGLGDAKVAVYAETVTTKVTFRELTPLEIEAYAQNGEGTDKAGGYAVQGMASGFVSRIEGSYTNVVGLPASEVLVALRRLALIR
jgi:septum formation protein